LLESYAAELGGDLSESELGLVRQAVALQLEAERLQADIVAGADIDRDVLIRVSSEARRALAALRGKAEKNKPTGPSLHEYLAQRYGEPADESEVAVYSAKTVASNVPEATATVAANGTKLTVNPKTGFAEMYQPTPWPGCTTAV
jgi:hypothetical protein